jgi:hypothetical protein
MPTEMLEVLGEVLATIEKQQMTVGLMGEGHAGAFDLLDQRGINVVTCATDEPIPDNVSIVMTFAPEVAAMCIEAGKQCALLIAVERLSTRDFHETIVHTKFDIYWPVGRSVMIHDGKSVFVSDMVWLIFHMGAVAVVKFNPIGNNDDVEIGSQDTEGGRDYDTDEEEARVRDQAIEENATEWHDGYHGDGGFIVGNAVEDGVPGMADLGADGERVLLPGQTIIRVRKPKQPKK